MSDCRFGVSPVNYPDPDPDPDDQSPQKKVPDPRIEPATVRIPGGRASDRASGPGVSKRIKGERLKTVCEVERLKTKLKLSLENGQGKE